MEVSIQANSLSISELGLDLTIKPNYLIHQMMDEDGRKMFRDIMFEKLDGILMQLVNDYNHIENSLTTESKHSIKEGKQIVKSLKEFATFVRQIAPTCFSFELEYYYDKVSKEKQAAIDWAYSIIRYNTAYGYKEDSKTQIKL